MRSTVTEIDEVSDGVSKGKARTSWFAGSNHMTATFSVAALKRTGADAVGGPIKTLGEGPSGETVALAVSSPCSL